MNGENGRGADPAPTSGGVPKHVAIIMDGNGRWAKRRFLPRIEGHRAGVKTVRMVVEESRRLGVRYLTLFAFSSENWNRPRKEVGALMALFERFLDSELANMKENGVRLRAIGALDRLPAEVRDRLRRAEEQTSGAQGLDLILAVSYGGRDELMRAMRSIADRVQEGSLKAEEINEKLIGQYLDAPDVPDPDLLIRTSNENRISNFLLWQLAYSEICVIPELWPEFSKERYQACLSEFGERKRRYGLTEEQMYSSSSGDSHG